MRLTIVIGIQNEILNGYRRDIAGLLSNGWVIWKETLTIEDFDLHFDKTHLLGDGMFGGILYELLLSTKSDPKINWQTPMGFRSVP